MNRGELESIIWRQMSEVTGRVLHDGTFSQQWMLDCVDVILAAVDAYTATEVGRRVIRAEDVPQMAGLLSEDMPAVMRGGR